MRGVDGSSEGGDGWANILGGLHVVAVINNVKTSAVRKAVGQQYALSLASRLDDGSVVWPSSNQQVAVHTGTESDTGLYGALEEVAPIVTYILFPLTHFAATGTVI